MNFLAHIALSNKIEDILIGNILEDYVVGRLDHPRNEWIKPSFKIGIGLHRLIDTMTDTDAAVSEAKKLLSTKHKKFAPILVDIFFDFYLTKHWDKFYDDSLEEVCKFSYWTFQKNARFCPEKMQIWINGLLKYQWLDKYGTHLGIQKALNNVSTMTKVENNMINGLEDLILHDQVLDRLFIDFYPRLQLTCNNFLSENANF